MSLTFLVFADFHYKEGLYASTVADLQAILQRAKDSGAELILHAGDLCNDYPASPEVTELLLHNPYDLPVFGCYGRQEGQIRTRPEPLIFSAFGTCLACKVVLGGTLQAPKSS